MNIEFNLCSLDNFLIGIMSASGEDDNGSFVMLSIGFGIFEVSLYIYDR